MTPDEIGSAVMRECQEQLGLSAADATFVQLAVAQAVGKAVDEEYDELCHLFACVVDHATGGVLSKTNYETSVYYNAIDDHIRRICDDELKETVEAEHAVGLAAWLNQHIAWSRATFGDGPRHEGLCKHIEKELDEIRRDPSDLSEWIDVVILALDGAWREGYESGAIVDALWAKLDKNMARRWPTTSDPSRPTEHIRDTNEAKP